MIAAAASASSVEIISDGLKAQPSKTRMPF
jgi:hypothetical protein